MSTWLISRRGELGELVTFMRTREAASKGLHHFGNSLSTPVLQMKLCKHGKMSCIACIKYFSNKTSQPSLHAFILTHLLAYEIARTS